MKRSVSTRLLAVLAVLAMVATTLVLGEPSRPATATVVRPIVTVQALCTQPTIIDVAAGEPTRGLSAVDGLLGLDDPLVLEAAREVSITDTEAGTFFVLIRDGELRLSILRPTGLPALVPSAEQDQPQTYRAFELPPGLADQEAVVVPGGDAVFVLFAGEDEPMSAIKLDAGTLTGDRADLSAGRAPEGVELTDPAARPGTAVAHGQLLWAAADDGTVWTYDADVDASDRWAELEDDDAGPLDGGVLVRDDDLVYGLFERDGGGVALRGYASPGSEAVETSLPDRDVAVEAATFPDSKRPGFLVRGGEGEDRAGVLTLRGERADLAWTEGSHAADPGVGLLLHDEAAAVLADVGDQLSYHVVDGGGDFAGTFTRDASEEDCVTLPGWSDAASVVSPLSAGPFLHLHDPSAQFDCIVDTRDGLDDLEENCGPDGPWSVDKGAAPDSDFTIEIERAVEEFRDDLDEDAPPSDEPADPEDLADLGPERLEEEFADTGLGIQEVDEDLTELCAEEEVTAVVAPELDGLEPVGDSRIRVDWSWSGGRCLPERYEIEICMVASDGDGCSETRTVDVEDRDGASNRLSHEVSSRPGRNYRINVTAIKKGIASSPSNTLSVTTPPSVPAPPEDVSASLSSSGVWTISWASCLDDRSCEQRPDGFKIAVQGCDGDSLPRQTHTVGSSERSVSYDVSGSGFRDTDLLGRKVRFTVAATAEGYESDAVSAGSCTESVRPGQSVSLSNSPVDVSLSGRTTSMTLEAPSRGSGLTRLFGTSSYDDISARLVRSSSSTSARTVGTGSSTTFTVDRCEESGWTVELTPRRGGSTLSNHRASISGVPAACDWAVTESTTPQVEVTGGNADSVSVQVTIPQLSTDVRLDKVDRVSAEVNCTRWDTASSSPTVSGGDINGDRVRFSVSTPAVFDLREGCRITTRVHGTDGERVALPRKDLDLRPATGGIVERVGPQIISSLRDSITGELDERGPGWRGRNNVVIVRNQDSVAGCGPGSWDISVRGGDRRPCDSGSHRQEFGRRDVERGRADITYRIRYGDTTYERTYETNVCGLDGVDSSAPPCADAPDECPYNPDIPEDDPACPEPCPHNSELSVDDPDCFCEWDPDYPPDHDECRDPDEPGDEEPGDEEPPEEEPTDPPEEDDGEEEGGEDPPEDGNGNGEEGEEP